MILGVGWVGVLVGLVCGSGLHLGRYKRHQKYKKREATDLTTQQPSNPTKNAPLQNRYFFGLGSLRGASQANVGQIWGVDRLPGEIRFICVFVSLFCDQLFAFVA